MQYLQVLRKFKYFCNVAIMSIKQICNRIPGFVQNGIITSRQNHLGDNLLEKLLLLKVNGPFW